VRHAACETQVFENGNSSGFSNADFDWDIGFYKGQCPNGQYAAGISTPAFTSVGLSGEVHALFCCTP
jgi:hypothetical protein